MTALHPQLAAHQSYRIAGTGYRMVVASPASDPELWEQYLRTAHEGYRRHGVEGAFELDVIRDGRSTTLFAVAVDDSSNMVAGIRMQAHESADDAPAVHMWDGQPGREELYRLVAERIPAGVVELKGAFVSDDADHRAALSEALLRAGVVAPMGMLPAQYIVAIVGVESQRQQWKSVGAVKEPADLPTSPYPSDRYTATPLWWDRDTFVDHVAPERLPGLLREIVQLTPSKASEQ
jgi:hypothetical protein